MNNVDNYSYYNLLDNTRRVLIGAIEPCFRGIAVEWQDDIIALYFYIDGDISIDLRDHCSIIGTEIAACYLSAGITENIIRLDYPNPLPKHCHWVFRRYEVLKIEELNSRDYKGLFLSSLYCLLGKILPSVRGVAAEQHNQSARLLFYFNGPINADIQKNVEEIMENVRGLNPTTDISMQLCRIDYPAPLPQHGLNWIFMSKSLSE